MKAAAKTVKLEINEETGKAEWVEELTNLGEKLTEYGKSDLVE
jgi:hypothetical protein